MIPFVPKRLTKNVNVERESHIRTFLRLGAGIAIFTFGGYLLLGLAADLMVSLLPRSVELWLDETYLKDFPTSAKHGAETRRLQALVEKLAGHLPAEDRRPMQVYVHHSAQENAFVAPGGTICVFSALLAKAKNENELAMVLGHEIGHLVHRDLMRAEGRTIVLEALGAALGMEEFLAVLVEHSFDLGEARFSQEEELAADLVGIELVNKAYGHVGGALEFFRRARDREGFPVIPEILMKYYGSHPLTPERITALERVILERGYGSGAVTPF